MKTNDTKLNFTLRIPTSMDKKVCEASSEIGVSKNAFILMVLSERFTTNKHS